jgi:predicted porin
MRNNSIHISGFVKASSVTALLIASGLAHAQSSVTLYGATDAGLIYTNKTLNVATGQNAGKQFSFTDGGLAPSIFGLTGVESLGGGLSTEFKLESGINVANGGYNNSNGNFFGRQAYVGLKGGFGEFKAGLQFSPYFLTLHELDPRGLSLFGSSLMFYVNNVLATGIFTPNAISYTSPTLWGFKASALMSLGGVAGDFQNGRQYSASLKYEIGPVAVLAGYFNARPSTGSALVTPVPTQLPVSFDGRQIGATYTIGSVLAKASFANYRVGSQSNDVYGGGLDWRVVPTVDLNAGVWYEQQQHQSANHSLLAAAGVNYYLSARTTAYAQVAIANNHGTNDTGLAISDALFGATGTTTGVTVGVRHSF